MAPNAHTGSSRFNLSERDWVKAIFSREWELDSTAIYVCQFDDGFEPSDCLQHQIVGGKSYATHNGLPGFCVYEEPKPVPIFRYLANRPLGSSLLCDIRARRIDNLVTSNLSNFGHSFLAIYTVLLECEKHAVKVHTFSGPQVSAKEFETSFATDRVGSYLRFLTGSSPVLGPLCLAARDVSKPRVPNCSLSCSPEFAQHAATIGSGLCEAMITALAEAYLNERN